MGKRWPIMVVFFSLIYYLGVRLMLVWRYGDVAFGYDAGIYRFFVSNLVDKFGDPSLGHFGFFSFLNILQWLGNSGDQILFGFYLVLVLIFFIAYYFLVKNLTNEKIAAFSVIIFSLSITQFEFYWWYYYRNFLGVILVMVILWLVSKKSKLIILFSIFLGIVHPASLLPIFFTLFFYFLIEKNSRKFLLIIGVLSLVGVSIVSWSEIKSYLPFFTTNYGLVNNFSVVQAQEFTGQFMEIKFYLGISLIYLIFGLLGVIYYGRKYRLMACLFVANLLIIALQIIFYRRSLIYIDLMACFFGAIFLFDQIEKINNKVFSIIFCTIFFGLLLWQNFSYCLLKQPLIEPTEMEQIKSLANYSINKSIISVSSYYAPWLYGYSGHLIIAPGMLDENRWSENEWDDFWVTDLAERRKELITKYYRLPILLYLGKEDMWFGKKIQGDSNFTKLNTNLWEFH